MMQAIDTESFSTIVREFYDLQKLRIATSNRLLKVPESDLLKSITADLERHEDMLQKRIKPELLNFEIYRKFLIGITGCGPLMSGCIITELGKQHRAAKGIAAFENPSKIVMYAGLAPRHVYKEKHNYKYNWFLKLSLLGEQKLVDQFIMHKHKFGYHKYLELREASKIKHPEKTVVDGKTMWNDGHLSNMAKKELAVIFLTNVWNKWRTLEGLPVVEPYVKAYMHHPDVVWNPDVWIDHPERLKM